MRVRVERVNVTSVLKSSEESEDSRAKNKSNPICTHLCHLPCIDLFIYLFKVNTGCFCMNIHTKLGIICWLGEKGSHQSVRVFVYKGDLQEGKEKEVFIINW